MVIGVVWIGVSLYVIVESDKCENLQDEVHLKSARQESLPHKMGSGLASCFLSFTCGVCIPDVDVPSVDEKLLFFEVILALNMSVQH